MQLEEIKFSDNIFVRLIDYIKCIAVKEGYITYNTEQKELESGYTGTVLAITIKGKTRQGDKKSDIFVKQIRVVEIPIYDVSKLYNRETFVYTDLYREMIDLQEKENVPIAERFKVAKAFDECNDEYIFLENLVEKGYKTYEKLSIVKLDYAELVVKNLARFHGLSIALQVKKPDYFEKNIKTMDCVYNFNDYFREVTQNMRKYVSQFLTDKVRERVAPLLENIVDKYPIYMKDTSCQVKTVCHGDYRHSNIMVTEINGRPVDVIAVDYQITFYGNPVLDFIYFIFWGTDQEFRRNHLDHLKKLYYQYIETFLGYFGIEVENVFPKLEFEKQYKEKLDFGLMISLFYLPYLFPAEDNVPSGKSDEPLDNTTMKVGPKYVKRFRGIVDDFIQWGYL